MYRQRNKYHNTKLKTEDGVFDSKKEYTRWKQLKVLESMGHITDLQRQVPYELIPHYKENGKVIERAVNYYADFVYTTEDGLQVVEDAKGLRTSDYVIKRKLMLAKYGIRIKEV